MVLAFPYSSTHQRTKLVNPLKPRIWKSAVETQQQLLELGFRTCVIGGIAVQRWGEPRVTKDVDFTLLCGFGNERQIVSEILRHFDPRIKDAEEFAIHARVLLVEDSRGTPLDISLGALPYEENVIALATPWLAPESGSLITCSAEDLVVLKAFANRTQDVRDIEGVIIRQGTRLNRSLVLKELTPLVELKEEPEILDQLQALFENHND